MAPKKKMETEAGCQLIIIITVGVRGMNQHVFTSGFCALGLYLFLFLPGICATTLSPYSSRHLPEKKAKYKM